jgi:DNA-binding Xre family transcriptional regulator
MGQTCHKLRVPSTTSAAVDPMPAKPAQSTEFERYAKRVQKRIKELRLERGMSQEDLMEYGLSLRTVQRIEKEGEAANLTLLTLHKLCKAFGVKPHEVLEV